MRSRPELDLRQLLRWAEYKGGTRSMRIFRGQGWTTALLAVAMVQAVNRHRRQYFIAGTENYAKDLGPRAVELAKQMFKVEIAMVPLRGGPRRIILPAPNAELWIMSGHNLDRLRGLEVDSVVFDHNQLRLRKWDSMDADLIDRFSEPNWALLEDFCFAILEPERWAQLVNRATWPAPRATKVPYAD